MLLGRVAGTLVASRKDVGLEGQKMLVVRELDVDGRETGGHVIAITEPTGQAQDLEILNHVWRFNQLIDMCKIGLTSRQVKRVTRFLITVGSRRSKD